MQGEKDEDMREADWWGGAVSGVGSLHPLSEQPHITPETEHFSERG